MVKSGSVNCKVYVKREMKSVFYVFLFLIMLKQYSQSNNTDYVFNYINVPYLYTGLKTMPQPRYCPGCVLPTRTRFNFYAFIVINQASENNL